jgi:hypothetical protein
MPTNEEIMRLMEAQQYEKWRQSLLKRNMAYADPQ